VRQRRRHSSELRGAAPVPPAALPLRRPGRLAHRAHAPDGICGFTLVELVVSLAIMSILLTGLASAILIASHALPSDADPVNTVVDAARVVDRLAEELAAALWIREHTARSVEFTVPDRTGDGVPERIRYAWSGTAGDPLQRQYNGGSVITVLAAVDELDLSYELRAETEEYPGPPTESAEGVLKSYTAATSLSDAPVHADQWWAEYFKPALPAETVSWKVTRAQFRAKRDNNKAATTTIQLRLPDTSLMPSDTIVDQTTMSQLSLSTSYQWVEKTFTAAAGLSPDTGLCLTFITSNPKSARLCYRSGGVVLADAGWIEGDPDWKSIVTDKALLFYIYGTYTTAGVTQTATRHYVTGVRIALGASADASRRVVTTIQTLNEPELLSGLWETGFDTNPTGDLNGDGVGDWQVSGGGPFDTASLSGGVWSADGVLETRPDCDFDRLTTVEVRFRDTVLAGATPGIWINADWSNGTCAPLLATLELQLDGTQTLTVYHSLDVATKQTLLTVPGLPADFVTLRLLIVPDSDTVNIKVNGQERGSFVYNTIVPLLDQRFVAIGTTGAGAEFDSVSIRISE